MRNTTPKGAAPPPGVTGEIQGTPYLYPDYQPGAVIMTNGKRVDIPLSYDLINHEVVIKIREEAMALPHTQLKAFLVESPEGDTLRFQKAHELPGGADMDLSPAVFVQVLYKGQLTLIGLHRKQFLATSNQTSYNNGRQEPEYDEQPVQYFLIQEGLEPMRMRLRKGWLLKQFPDQKAEIKAWSNQENLSLNTKTDLTRLIEWLDVNL